MKYSPGDVAYILPKNNYENVDYLLKLLGLDPNIVIEDMKPANEGMEFNCE
jgi:sulfite reductase alpha subunit-like flavoprotein